MRKTGSSVEQAMEAIVITNFEHTKLSPEYHPEYLLKTCWHYGVSFQKYFVKFARVSEPYLKALRFFECVSGSSINKELFTNLRLTNKTKPYE
jgi:hypothetical protein